MSHIRTMHIIGGRNANPAVLRTKLEPMKLEDNMGIAAKFIAFGEVSDMRGSDCNFIIKDSIFEQEEVYVPLSIPEGRYVTREKVLVEIKKTINSYLNSKALSILSSVITVPECTTASSESQVLVVNDYTATITITPPKGIEIVPKENNSIWSIIKAFRQNTSVWVFTGDLEDRTGMAFIYMNIVENSYINGKKSRVLTAFPVQSKSGYSYHEFANSNYIPVEVKEFTEIEIELRDIQGKLLNIDKSYDTIISLHISPINRY